MCVSVWRSAHRKRKKKNCFFHTLKSIFFSLHLWEILWIAWIIPEIHHRSNELTNVWELKRNEREWIKKKICWWTMMPTNLHKIRKYSSFYTTRYQVESLVLNWKIFWHRNEFGEMANSRAKNGWKRNSIKKFFYLRLKLISTLSKTFHFEIINSANIVWLPTFTWVCAWSNDECMLKNMVVLSSSHRNQREKESTSIESSKIYVTKWYFFRMYASL